MHPVWIRDHYISSSRLLIVHLSVADVALFLAGLFRTNGSVLFCSAEFVLESLSAKAHKFCETKLPHGIFWVTINPTIELCSLRMEVKLSVVWRMYHAMKLVLVLFIWIVDSCCTSSKAKLCDNVDVLVFLHCLSLKLHDWVLPVHILDLCLWGVTGSSEFRWGGHWKLS